MSKIRIVAAILDTTSLILYKENGEKIEIPQGDPRIKPIIDLATEPLSRNEVVEVDLEHVNEYHEFEKKSSGLVRFFRVAKNMVKHIFTGDAPHEEPVELGTVPVPAPLVPSPAASVPVTKPVTSVPSTVAPSADQVSDRVQNSKPSLQTATDQIMSQAKPVSDKDYRQSDTTSQDTMIATVDGKIIPGMENLQKQFAHAAKMGNTTGVTNFLKRIAAVIDKRGHSIDDLLRFMERGDLPISDDGSIIAYKRLQSTTDSSTFVDVHSKNVTQRVGSFVVMDESMVDPNRRNECSNGLHIARRGYLRSFSGDVLVMCKIAPEDVIAVPAYDSNKVRVCAYHILGRIIGKDQSDLISDRPMTSEAGRELLTAALRGAHIERIEEVRITSGFGGGLKITPLIQGKHKKTVPVKAADDAVAFDDAKNTVGAVDPTKVAAETLEKKTVTPATPVTQAPETRAEKIKRLIEVLRGKDAGNVKVDAARELIGIGKAVKKSLGGLGLSNADINLVNQWVQNQPAPKSEPKVEDKAPAKSPDATITEQKRLFAECRWDELYALKKAKKKSWSALGFNNTEEKIILDHTPKK